MWFIESQIFYLTNTEGAVVSVGILSWFYERPTVVAIWNLQPAPELVGAE